MSSSDDDDVSNRVYHTAGNDGKQRVKPLFRYLRCNK